MRHLFWTAMAWLLVGFVATVAAERPNILLIITDDQGWGDLSCHGNPYLRTPAIDSLRRDGVSLERFYVSPVCAPTRAALLTGRYYLRTGVHGVTRGYERMRAEEVTLAEVLRAHGYVTGCFGKWHNGSQYPHHPNGQGFDEFVGFCAGHWNNYFDPILEHNGVFFRAKGYIADALTDYAIAFIRQNRDRPFFCYLPYNTPHSPFQVPDRYFDRFKRLGLDGRLACVYGMCENLDHNVARLLGTLEELGLSENTIVLFTTDNGPNTDRYNGGMKGRKGSVDEGGVRVPCFIRYPGRLPAGRAYRQIAADIDVMPTLLELAGIGVPEGVKLDGRSLVPLFDSDRDPLWPDRLLFQHWSGERVVPTRGAVRSQRYRAVYRPGGRWELYDMESDPCQTLDLAGLRPELLEPLRAAYERWFKDVTARGFDPIPVEVGHPGWDEVVLPGHEAILMPGVGKGIGYFGPRGWANDWISGWRSVDAYAWWPIKVVRPGRYVVALRYACPPDQVGSRVEVRVGDASVGARVAEPFVPETIPSPDRVPRREVYERTWGTLELGTLELRAGEYRLELRCTELAHEAVGEFKAVVLKRVQ